MWSSIRYRRLYGSSHQKDTNIELNLNLTGKEFSKNIKDVEVVPKSITNSSERFKQSFEKVIYRLPWYFKNGKKRPKPSDKRESMFPFEDPASDRIQNQLMFIPENYDNMKQKGNKVIFLVNGAENWEGVSGQDVFLKNRCPVYSCTITDDRSFLTTANLLLYKDVLKYQIKHSEIDQIHMLYILESVMSIAGIPPGPLNWTATYRRTSDIVSPYEKWVYFDPKVKQKAQKRNYALNKSKKVAWFVSNCNANNARLQYTKELQKYIQVSEQYNCRSFDL